VVLPVARVVLPVARVVPPVARVVPPEERAHSAVLRTQRIENQSFPSNPPI
jgi:hypothetical protein